MFNRVNMTLDVYDKYTDDLLTSISFLAYLDGQITGIM